MNAISDGGEEGLVREEDEAPTKETGNRFEFTVARRGESCGDSCEGGGDISRLY